MEDISRRRFISVGAIAAATGAMLATGCGSSSASSSSDSTEGAKAYTGTAMGKHGNIKVQVLMDGDSISDIQVLDSRETQGLGDVAMEKLTKLIVDNQTLNVDTITGATLSSDAFILATRDALDQAGQDSAAWTKRDKATEALPDEIPASADIIVIGAGGAGFAASITAANLGKKVILMEKMGILGGDTALSGGEMAVPGNWIQQQAGDQDSPELLAQDMLTGGDNIGDPALVEVIANGTYDSAMWLTYEGGVPWEHDLLFFGGHSVERSIIPKDHTGSTMTTRLTTRAKKIKNITILDNMRATDLVADASGKITGVKAESQIDGSQHSFTAGAIVLTSGGFGSNIDMRVKYNPDMDSSILSTDSVGATGDGLTMASAIGANLLDMQYIQTYPTCDPQTGALLYVDDMRLESLAIMVNKEGDRFVEELGRRDVLSKAITQQTDGIGYMLFNQAGADETDLLNIHADEYENLESRGLIVKGDTLDEVCEPFGVDATELQKTVDKWNQFCKDGKDTDFNYRGDLNPIEGGPYYLNSYKPAVHYTMGGLQIDTVAQVYNTSGAVIPGLFAAGEVAGHKMGDNRLGSCSMADIYTFGRIAGKSAVAYLG